MVTLLVSLLWRKVTIWDQTIELEMSIGYLFVQNLVTLFYHLAQRSGNLVSKRYSVTMINIILETIISTIRIVYAKPESACPLSMFDGFSMGSDHFWVADTMAMDIPSAIGQRVLAEIQGRPVSLSEKN